MKKLFLLLSISLIVSSCEEHPPFVVSILRSKISTSKNTNAKNVSFHVTFSEPVSGVNISDFNLKVISGNIMGSISDVSSIDDSSYTVFVDNLIGDGELRLDLYDDDNSITDEQKETLLSNTFITGESYEIDQTPPSVLSIVRGVVPGANPSSDTSVDFFVTFDSAVRGLNIEDFRTTILGEGAPVITNVSGGPIFYTVSIDTTAVRGDIGLDFYDEDQSVEDLSGNAASSYHSSDELWSVHSIAPSVVVINRGSSPVSNPTRESIVSFNVVFSESVVNISSSDFVVSIEGSGTPVISSIVGTGAIRTILVDVSGVIGKIGLNLADLDDSITNALNTSLDFNSHKSDEFWVKEL